VVLADCGCGCFDEELGLRGVLRPVILSEGPSGPRVEAIV
jgi:hypothetical protein